MKYAVPLIAVFSLLCGNSLGQNKIREARYTTVPAPNYRIKKNIENSLTDGKNAVHDIFWLDPQTAGWEKRPKITLNFTFDREYSISKITLNTAMRESADVFLPLNIHVFASTDNKNFSYLGDLMETSRVPRDNAYRIVELKLSGLRSDAKYIRFIVIPGGTFFFTDEVSFYGSEAGGAAEKGGKQVSSVQMETIVEREKYAQINRSFLLKRIDAESKDAGNGQRRTLQKLREQIIADENLADSARYRLYEAGIWKSRVQPELKQGLILTKYDSPWLSQMDQRSSPILKETIVSAVHATEYIAYNLFNNTQQNLTVTPAVSARASQGALSLYHAKEVRSNDFKVVPDALIPLRMNEPFRLKPGESKVLMVGFKSSRSGDAHFKIDLRSRGKAIASISADIKVLPVSMDFGTDGQKLNINTWAYFNFPTLKGREASAREDLLSHYVNTYVLHTSVLQSNTAQNHYPRLAEHLKYIKGADQVLLFLNHRQLLENPGGRYMSDAWKKQFLEWYDKVMPLIIASGISQNDIYLYPYDEVRQTEVKSFQNFVTWVRSVRENVKIFVTVVAKGVLPKLKEYADIYQLYDNPDLLKDGASVNGASIWYYDIIESSKSASPYKDYRLMGWKAFGRGVEGIGFWNYADVGNNRKEVSVWDDFDGHRPDYAVVYDLGARIISSRRWEAFKTGVEDYMVLKMYSRKFGEKAAKALCKPVLAAPDNFALADQTRARMLEKLAREK